MKTKKSKLILKAIKKTLKLRYIFILIVLFSANTFAWFIYSSTVSGSISARVKAWEVTFQSGDEDLTTYVDIDVSDIYPGMDDYSKEITAYNKSEVPATVRYTILSSTILGKTTYTVEGKNNKEMELTGDEMTSAEYVEYIAKTYPFKIVMSSDKEEMDAKNGVATFTVKVSWDFESGDDEKDTYWGNQAAKFLEDNPDESCIKLNVLLQIDQIEE